jgi:hypothetical protein
MFIVAAESHTGWCSCLTSNSPAPWIHLRSTQSILPAQALALYCTTGMASSSQPQILLYLADTTIDNIYETGFLEQLCTQIYKLRTPVITIRKSQFYIQHYLCNIRYYYNRILICTC